MSETQTEETPSTVIDESTTPAPEGTLLAGKFKTSDDLEKAYKELEKKLGSQGQHQETPQTESPEIAPKEDIQIEAPEPMTLEKITEKYGQLYVENEGKLLDSHYDELAQLGYPRGIVEQYIRGQVAESARQQDQVHNVFGGEDKTQTVLQWAAENLSPKEVQSMNQQLKDNPEIGAQMLKLRYEAEVPQTGLQLDGRGTPVGHTDVFHSQEEVVQAMRHPERGKNGAYDLKLRDKINRSIQAGTLKG